MNRLKILYFLAHPYHIGGAAKVLLKQAEIIKKLGHTVKVVIQNDDNNSHSAVFDELCIKKNLKYTSCIYPIATCIEEIDLLGAIDCYSNVKNIIDEYRPDIMHSVQLNISVEMVARYENIPHLMNIYPTSVSSFNISWMNIFPQYHSSDSELFCRRWSEGINITSKCLRVPYEPHDNSECVSQSKNSNRLSEYNLICIGYFSALKNQLEILYFVKMCIEQGYDVHIIFLGDVDNKYGEKCKDYVQNNNMSNIVEFTGFLIDIDNYLREADLLIHASVAESYPGVIVEAMANKVPVLCTPAGGVPELVKDGINGFLTEGFTANDLMKCFKRYIYHKNTDIKNIISEAYLTYKNNHTYQKQGEGLEEYYSYIISHRKKDHDKELVSNMNDAINSIKMFYDKQTIKYEYTKKHMWYLYYLSLLKKKQDAWIWGAGKMGQYALEWIQLLGWNVKGYIDTNKEGNYLGYSVIKPNEMELEKNDIVFVAVADFEALTSITKFLEKKRMHRNIDYFLVCNNPSV